MRSPRRRSTSERTSCAQHRPSGGDRQPDGKMASKWDRSHPWAMANRLVSSVLLAAIAALAFVPASAGAAGDPSPSASPAPSAGTGTDQDARDYCVAQGGQLVDRIATSNTNGDSAAQLQ